MSSFGFGGEYTGPLCLPNLENYPTALCYLILTPDISSLPLKIVGVTLENGQAPWSTLGNIRSCSKITSSLGTALVRQGLILSIQWLNHVLCLLVSI